MKSSRNIHENMIKILIDEFTMTLISCKLDLMLRFSLIHWGKTTYSKTSSALWYKHEKTEPTKQQVKSVCQQA